MSLTIVGFSGCGMMVANILFCMRIGRFIIVFLHFSDYLISLIEILFGLLNLNLEFPNHLNIFCDTECKIKDYYDKEIFFNVLNVLHGSNFFLKKGFD